MKHLIKDANKALEAKKPVTIAVNTTGKLLAYKPVADLVASIDKDKPKLFVGKWKANLLDFENDQRCEVIALVASCLDNGIVLEGSLASKVDSLGQDAIQKMVNSDFWSKWYGKHIERFNAFFKDGTTDKYTLSVIYYLKKSGHTFKKYQ